MKQSSLKKKLDANIKRDIDSVVSGSRDALSDAGKRYLKCIVDPRSAKPCGVPSVIGGFHGPTRAVRVKARGQATVGNNGVGLISFDPELCGPYNDRIVAGYTSATSFAYIPATGTIPSAAVTGYTSVTWGDAPFEASGAKPDSVLFRCVGAAIYVTPTAARLDQGGRIRLYEAPAHANSSYTVAAEIQSSNNTRSVTGVVATDESTVCLNWHPRAHYGPASPFDMQTHTVFNSTVLPQGPLVVLLEGKTSDAPTFDFEIYAIYEVVGRHVKGRRPQVYDSRAMDLIQTTFASKSLSGWAGKVEHVEQGYLATAWHWGQKLSNSASRLWRENRGTIKQVASLAGMLL
jgi:hypothetical protein